MKTHERFAQPGPSFATLMAEVRRDTADEFWLRRRLMRIGFSFKDANGLAFGRPYGEGR